MKERPRRGIGMPSSKSLSDLPSMMLDTPTPGRITPIDAASTSYSSAKRKPSHQEFQHPTSRTITRRPSSVSSSSRSTGCRPARPPSPELPQAPTFAKAFKRPRLDDRHATPYYPRNAASTSPPRKRPSATSNLPSLTHAYNGSNDQEGFAASLSASQPPTFMREGSKKKKSPQDSHLPNNDQGDAASLPSPPASPVPSAMSDTSLPNLADIFPPRNQASTKQHSPVRPLGQRIGRMSPSRPDGSPSRNTSTAQMPAGQSITPKRKARPPLIPNFQKNTNTPTRKEPSAAEMDAVRAAVLARSPEANRAQLAPTVSSPKTATQPGSSLEAASTSFKPRTIAVRQKEPVPLASVVAASTPTETTQTALPSSSPHEKPDVAAIAASDSLPLPQAGLSTPRSTAPEKTATPSAKQEQSTPKVKRALPSSSAAKVKEEVIDLTLDSENEDEGDDKRNVKRGLAQSSGGSTATTAATGPSAEMKAEIIDRKNASEHATDLLNELDIFDVGNIQALVNVGYKSTSTFVKRLPLLDIADRRNILEELTKEMGKLDFGILRAYLKRQGVELEN